MFIWFTGSDTEPPVLLGLRSSKTFIITTVALAVFTDVFLYTIIVPVLPFALTIRAHLDPASIQTWISIFLAVYGAALLLASPICGWLADQIDSRRWPMLLGLLALVASTVLICFGRSIAILAVGRVLQGLSGAVVWVVGLALLVDTVGSEGIGEAMGYVGLGLSVSTLLGPLLGGIVFAKGGYYAVFAMQYGLICLDIFMRVMMVEKKVAAKWLPAAPAEEVTGMDSTPSDDLEECVTTIKEKKEVEVTILQRSSEEASAEMTRTITIEPTLTTSDLPRTRVPPVITLLSSRRLLSALWCVIAVATLYTAMDAVLPLFVRNTFHWTSLGAGLIFLPVFVGSFLGPIVGSLSDKHGPRWFVLAGSILACPTLVLLRLVHENTLRQKILLCVLLVVMGICLTFVITPIMAEITYAVEAKAKRRPAGFFGKYGAYAQAYSLFNSAWAAGCMIGPLLGGLTNGSGGWGTSTLILGGISVFTAVPAVIWTGGSIFKKRKSEMSAALGR